MGLKGQILLLFWCLMPKGGEIKAKKTGSANHLWISKMLVLDSCCLIKTLLLQKLFSYGGEIWLWEKGGVFGIWSNLLLRDLLISQNKCFWHRDRKNNLFCENKPSGGKSDPNMPNHKWDKFVFKFALVSFSLKCCCYLSNRQNGGDWKRNVPVAHFYKCFGD
jgi:hypothetical protein